MPRPTCRRNIGFLPSILRFKPAGIRAQDLDEVLLGHDELEALRLKDLIGLSQEEAAKQMNVSQPTFHRLINAAHRKIADTVVNGKALTIEGGNIAFDESTLPPCGRVRRRCQRAYGRGGEVEINMPGQLLDGLPRELEKGGIMRIAITSTDGTIEGMVDERFGRCRKIVLYDPDTKNFEVVDNTMNMGASQGAGIQTSQNVINSGAKAVISGHLGPNAYRVLQAAGVDVYTVSGVTVAQAIKAFEEGKLARLDGPDVSGHW